MLKKRFHTESIFIFMSNLWFTLFVILCMKSLLIFHCCFFVCLRYIVGVRWEITTYKPRVCTWTPSNTHCCERCGFVPYLLHFLFRLFVIVVWKYSDAFMLYLANKWKLVRRPVELDGYKPPPELVRILPPGKGQKNDGQRIGPKHKDFSKVVANF